MVRRLDPNRPFPSSVVPLFQRESKCKTILMKMTLICMKMKLHAELLFSTCTNPIIHFFYPPKICIGIVLNYSWDMFMSQEKLQTMSMQNFGGVKEVHYGIVQVVNERFRT